MKAAVCNRMYCTEFFVSTKPCICNRIWGHLDWALWLSVRLYLYLLTQTAETALVYPKLVMCLFLSLSNTMGTGEEHWVPAGQELRNRILYCHGKKISCAQCAKIGWDANSRVQLISYQIVKPNRLKMDCYKSLKASVLSVDDWKAYAWEGTW